jgi:hypothetical protein
VTRYLAGTAAVAAIALGLASVSGPASRRAALIGAGAASVTAFGSLLAMARSARSVKPLRGALLVMGIGFLARIVLVALGTVMVVRAGESVVAFVIAFFVPYFIFAAIEGWYLASLQRGPGTPA